MLTSYPASILNHIWPKKGIPYDSISIRKTLGGLGRQFDLIECVGVLHHLGDPLAGWRVLVSLLKPGGS